MVIWSGAAKADLRDIFDHIARDSRFYARKTIEDLVQRSEGLLTFPRIGRVVPRIQPGNYSRIADKILSRYLRTAG